MTNPARDERISIDVEDPEEALRALLAVDPDSDPIEAEDTEDTDPDE